MLRQFLTLSAGEGAARGIHALAILLLARFVTADTLGRFGWGQALASYATLAVQFGLDVPGVREVSRCPERLETIRGAILAIRLVMLVSILLCFGAWMLLSPEARTEFWLLIFFLGLPAAQALQQRWALLAQQRSRGIAIGAILGALFFLSGVAVFRGNLSAVAAALACGEFASAAVMWRFSGGGVAWPTRRQAVALAINSSPLALSLFLGNMLYNFDIVALHWLGTKSQTGFYLATYRLITVFSPILAAMQSSALAHFSLTSEHAWPRLRSIIVPSLVIAVLIACALAALAAPLVRLIYGTDYQGAIALLRVLAWTLPIQVPRMLFRQLLFARGRQRADLINLLVAVIANVTLDLLLTPGYGAMGCAFSTLLSELLFLAGTVRTAREIAS